jgi:hypothetical protein
MADSNSPYGMFVAWSEAKAVTPQVSKDGKGGYIITVSIDSPVSYVAQGTGATIDEAAKQVIDELETVHAWEDGKPKSRFSFA